MFLEYKNMRILVWEPVLENISVNYEQVTEQNRSQRRVMVSDTALSINVSLDFIDMVQFLAQSFQSFSKKKVLKSLQKHTAFFIYNNLGYDLTI